VTWHSNLDLLVQPASSAKLAGAENHLAKDHGHLSMLLSPSVARGITAALVESGTAVATAKGRARKAA
jgi:hypothetical protein